MPPFKVSMPSPETVVIGLFISAVAVPWILIIGDFTSIEDGVNLIVDGPTFSSIDFIAVVVLFPDLIDTE